MAPLSSSAPVERLQVGDLHRDPGLPADERRLGPVVGDLFYLFIGESIRPLPGNRVKGLTRQMLHAALLGITYTTAVPRTETPSY